MKEPLIVAPLDGSELAERALPYVSLLAKAMRARILLVTAWAGQNGGFARSLGHDWRDFRNRAKRYFQGYLEDVAAALVKKRSDVETRVEIGDPASKLLAVVRGHEPSLLVMATHGRSGLGRWWYGSVADKLVREAPSPTLVVGPGVLSARATVRPVRRILVPLDGSPIAEEALPHAVTLAEALKASLTIVQVVTPAIYLLPFPAPQVDTVRIDKQLVGNAEQYLNRQSKRLKTQRPVKTLVVRGQPAEALLALQEKRRFDLVVMTSHARKGLGRAMLGSVTDRVIHGPAPVLIVRPKPAAKARRR
jgi:nucleotide-binding universal stress UspA family protein